jgi:hypothetical protein
MLASITPLGQRGRGASWGRTVVAYVITSVIGGAVMGLALGALGDVTLGTGHDWPVLVVGALAPVAAASDLRGRPPSWHRQVDETWLTTYRDWVHGAGFGFQLGLGAVTIVTSASLYLTWLLELVIARPLASALVGAAFGLTRALPLLTTASAKDPATLRASHRRWQAWQPPVRWLTTAVQVAAGAVLLAGAR